MCIRDRYFSFDSLLIILTLQFSLNVHFSIEKLSLFSLRSDIKNPSWKIPQLWQKSIWLNWISKLKILSNTFFEIFFFVEKKSFLKIIFLINCTSWKRLELGGLKQGRFGCFSVHHGRVGGLQFWLCWSGTNLFF